MGEAGADGVVDGAVGGGVYPAEQGHVGDREAVADDVLVGGEVGVEDAVEALGLADVALDGVGDLLLGGADEVVGLALHGAEAAVLPAHPGLAAGVVVVVGGEGEEVVAVVAAGEVAEDGDALEDAEAVVVVVDDGGDAAVGADGGEPGLLLDAAADVDGLGGVLQAVGVLELLEEDGDLVTVGSA